MKPRAAKVGLTALHAWSDVSVFDAFSFPVPAGRH